MGQNWTPMVGQFSMPIDSFWQLQSTKVYSYGNFSVYPCKYSWANFDVQIAAFKGSLTEDYHLMKELEEEKEIGLN